jgi:hypothetical protein
MKTHNGTKTASELNAINAVPARQAHQLAGKFQAECDLDEIKRPYILARRSARWARRSAHA